ncbi:MAG: 4-hydroxy-3-methylbut-2-enyl diphosphate reductase [Dehalococcoidia bacterium]
MEIEKAAEMGFCFGVRRAIEIVEKAAQDRGSLQTLGALVHNQQVVNRLAEFGVSIVDSLDDVRDGAVAITSHGAGPEAKEQIAAKGLDVIDATCPFVRKAQVVAQRLGKSGFWVLVFGDSDHPEIRGVLGWAGQKASASLEIPQLGTLPRRLGILCQTTESQQRFAQFVTRIISAEVAGFSELRIFNTICDVTRKHQEAAVELAARVDLMLVIGGWDSANTRRLAETCVSTGVATHQIETAGDIDPHWLRGRRHVGVTAGTSTPDEVIDEVVLALEETADGN